MEPFFLSWARATEGHSPALAYALTDCDYPPFTPYWLTLVERIRLTLGWPVDHRGLWVLVKLPSILAHAAGVLAIGYFLRKPLGQRLAIQAALAWALCLPVFLSSAIWGQMDALLASLLVLTAVACLRNSPAWIGATIAIALLIKLQAVVIGVALLVWVAIRFGIRGILVSGATFALLLTLTVGPMIVFGGQAGRAGVLRAYTNVDRWPRRQMMAHNLWFVADAIETRLLKRPDKLVYPDTREFFAGFTHKHLGLLLFAFSVIWIVRSLARHPTHARLILAMTLCGFAMYQLATQQHGRYSFPFVAILALAWPLEPRWRRLIVVLWISASINLALGIVRGNLFPSELPTQLRLPYDLLTHGLSFGMSLFNPLILTWGLLTLHRSEKRA
jgi:hypothetical protein